MSELRVLPSIDELRNRAAVQALARTHGEARTLRALRTSAQELRDMMQGGTAPPIIDRNAASQFIERRLAECLGKPDRTLRRVINATGVVLHTNLGRAPLSQRALDALREVASGYSTLEYDLARGKRGSRHRHAEHALCDVTGAEAAVVVNNNAAATLLTLAAMAAGREVIVSRGELVEIGGGYRVPDVMAQSGAVLREVGTTNRTRLSDYRAAIGPRTALLLRVHRGNFRIEGFTEQPELGELAALGREHAVPVAEDLGSGSLAREIAWEPSVQDSLAAGVDLVAFSGDKMLGGPQAGVIVGRSPLIERLRAHPLMRALRVDKLTLSALEATVTAYRDGEAPATVPVLTMLLQTRAAIETRARALAQQLTEGGWRTSLIAGQSAVGGGSAPGVELPTALLALGKDDLTADELAASLRQRDPPVIARIDADRVVLDLRTVLPEEDHDLARALTARDQGAEG